MEGMREAQASQQQATSGVDDSQCEWSEPKAEVKRTGEKAMLAGYQAERVTVIATQSCKDKESDQVCDFGLVLDQWVAPRFEASSRSAGISARVCGEDRARMRRHRAISPNAPSPCLVAIKACGVKSRPRCAT